MPHTSSPSERIDEVVVRLVRQDEAPATFAQIASIHRKEVPEGFLSSLGETFLTALYGYLSHVSTSFLFVAERDGKVLGFICCTTGASGLYSRFLRAEPLSVAAALIPRLWRLRTMAKLWEVLAYPARPALAALPRAEILNFCVSGDYKGKGLGGRLFCAAMAEFASRGIPRIRIVTGANQVTAQKLYEARGARLICRLEVHRGVGSIAYLYDIESENPGPHASYVTK